MKIEKIFHGLDPILLSILIPTLPERSFRLKNLVNDLTREIHRNQYALPIEIIICTDNREHHIGYKRNMLYQHAIGLFSVQIDDDDQLNDSYLELVTNAIHEHANIDSIGYYIEVLRDGAGLAIVSAQYDDWYPRKTKNNPKNKGIREETTYWQCPGLKVPIKTELCRDVVPTDMSWGEDYIFAKKISKKIKREYFIDEIMYFYHSYPKQRRHYGPQKINEK